MSVAICRWMLAVYAFLSSLAPASAALVYVQAGQREGQGITRWRADGCLVVTPAHVVEQLNISIVGPNNLQSDATLLYKLGNDIAILKIMSNSDLFCPSGETWDDGADISTILATERQGLLNSLTASGGQRSVPARISIVDIPNLVVEPIGQQDRIVETMSGSVLFITNRPMGMLLMERDGGKKGVVYRWDQLAALVAPVFATKRGCTISIDTDPSGATVATDGSSLGTTPLHIDLSDRSRTYSLSIQFSSSYSMAQKIDCRDTRDRLYRLSDMPTHSIGFAISSRDSEGAPISDCDPTIRLGGKSIRDGATLTMREGKYTLALSGTYACRDGYRCDTLSRRVTFDIDNNRQFMASFVRRGEGCGIQVR